MGTPFTVLSLAFTQAPDHTSHLNLDPTVLPGALTLRAGAWQTGETNLREAVSAATDSLGESHPDTAIYEAHLALGQILARAGNTAEARAHIAKAAQSPDPAIHDAAEKALR